MGSKYVTLNDRLVNNLVLEDVWFEKETTEKTWSRSQNGFLSAHSLFHRLIEGQEIVLRKAGNKERISSFVFCFLLLSSALLRLSWRHGQQIRDFERSALPVPYWCAERR